MTGTDSLCITTERYYRSTAPFDTVFSLQTTIAKKIQAIPQNLPISQTQIPLLSVCGSTNKQWPTQKISERGQVSSQSCDVINQLQGKCRRHDHSRGVRRHVPGKILQKYT